MAKNLHQRRNGIVVSVNAVIVIDDFVIVLVVVLETLHRPKKVSSFEAHNQARRLEGSRFLALQLYGLVASGSRERFDAIFCP
jgi:hypothetical protein